MRDDALAEAETETESFMEIERRLTPPAAKPHPKKRTKKRSKEQRRRQSLQRLLTLWHEDQLPRLQQLARGWLHSGILHVEHVPSDWPAALVELVRAQAPTPKLRPLPPPAPPAPASEWWHASCAGEPTEAARFTCSAERLHSHTPFSGAAPDAAWFLEVHAWMLEHAAPLACTTQPALARALHAAHPELPLSRWAGGIQTAARQQKTEERAARAVQKAEEAARILLNAQDTARRLGVSVHRVRQWTTAGELVPHKHQTFHKWGKTLQTAYYDQARVDAFAKARLGAGSGVTADDAWWKAVAASGGAPHDQGLLLPWQVADQGWALAGQAWMPCPDRDPGQTAADQVRGLHERLGVAVERHFRRFLALMKTEPCPSPEFEATLKTRLNAHVWAPVSLLAWEQTKCDGRRAWLAQCQAIRRALIVDEAAAGPLGHLARGDYPGLFPAARALGRRLHAVLGPTNSGKTHRALEALRAAPSGVYLAPLRLLAHEVAERLNAAGVPCDLVTGEEVVRVPGARHVAATIEAGWSAQAVDVAVIDEVQLLGDPDRGWAWTQALVGTPAREVWGVGSLAAEPALHELARRLGEPLTVERLERKGALSVLDRPMTLAQLAPGDALIAFSRGEVLQWREALRQRGLEVACIYGALGPEVRRAEAERFRSGQAQVLVATDAIGMGLNLPIARVVFTTLVKFDGICERGLSTAEIQQIAGRAGRFGLHEAGLVGHLAPAAPDTMTRLRHAVRDKVPALDTGRFSIQPTWPVMQAILAGIGLKATLEQGLRAFFAIVPKAPGWRCGYGQDVLDWAERLPATHLPLAEQFAVLGCPVTRNNADQAVAWLTQIARGHRAEAHSSLLYEGGHWAEPGAIDTPDGLQAAEAIAQLASVYRWLALRYPMQHPDLEEVTRMVRALQAGIAATLARQALKRRCATCGSRKMSANLKFVDCDPCYQKRVRAREERNHGDWW